MRISRIGRILFWAFAVLVFLCTYLPLVIIGAASFNKKQSFAIPSFGDTTLKWWGRAIENPDAREALFASVKIAFFATAFALIVGTLAALALNRTKFFGKTSLNLFIVLPISLPGIVTGIALGASFSNFGFKLGAFTVIIAHATFCIVVIFNNTFARLHKLGPSLAEASSDLGAGQWRTFRSITFPMISSALIAGALLAFALSFDEIVVTTFTSGATLETLPLWIFKNISRPKQLPIVNVVATIVILTSILPVMLAQKLTADD